MLEQLILDNPFSIKKYCTLHACSFLIKIQVSNNKNKTIVHYRSFTKSPERFFPGRSCYFSWRLKNIHATQWLLIFTVCTKHTHLHKNNFKKLILSFWNTPKAHLIFLWTPQRRGRIAVKTVTRTLSPAANCWTTRSSRVGCRPLPFLIQVWFKFFKMCAQQNHCKHWVI